MWWLKTCGGSEAFTYTTTVMKHSVKTIFGGQERYILNTHLEFLYQGNLVISLYLDKSINVLGWVSKENRGVGKMDEVSGRKQDEG